MPQSLKLVGRGGGIAPGLYLVKVSGVRTTNSLNITTADVEVITQLDLGASRKRGSPEKPAHPRVLPRLSKTQTTILMVICERGYVFTVRNLRDERLKGIQYASLQARCTELHQAGFIEIARAPSAPRQYFATAAGWRAINKAGFVPLPPTAKEA